MKKLFDIQDGRIMLSLGPLSHNKKCSYSCPFCYVGYGGFASYDSMSVQEIITWVRNQQTTFNIIYISGDTDSFAPPRTEKALQLLEGLSEFGVDLLFTTRYVFDDKQLEVLRRVNNKQKKINKLLIGCVSISQLNDLRVEPEPIPSVNDRIYQLKRFKQIGIASVLAMRPLLPTVPLNDYLKLVDLVKNNVDLILGSDWFTDQNGEIESKVLNGDAHNFSQRNEKMDFYSSSETWNVYENKHLKQTIKKYCTDNNIKFYIRSQPAVQYMKEIYRTDR
jgi:DNA repair photolyase